MANKKGGTAAFYLLCVLCFATTGVMMTFATSFDVGASVHVRRPQHLVHRTTSPRPPKPPRVIGNNTTWCIVKPSISQEQLDVIISFCCKEPKVDCKVIQPGGMCYLPPNKISDASVVMNIYYSLNGKNPFNCSFNGTGLIVTQDPSVGKCIYQV